MKKMIVRISLTITMMTLLLGIGANCVSAANTSTNVLFSHFPWITFEPGPVTAISDGHGGMKTLLPIHGRFPGGI